MTISDKSNLSRCKDVVGTELDGEMVLLNPASGDIFGLRDVGLAIWTHLDQSMTFEDLVAALVDEFEVSQEQCRADVVPFLEELCANGFIHVS